VHASHEALTRRSPWLTLLECVKRHGVGEREDKLGGGFYLSSVAKITDFPPKNYVNSDLPLLITTVAIPRKARKL
jgi:hypothetical protein